MLINFEELENTPWYVVYTIHRNEKKVYSELLKRTIPAFLPLQRVIRLWGGRKKQLDVPLFPNYLFVKLPVHRFWTVRNIPGVVRFVEFNGVPATISNSEIETMKKLVSGDDDITFLETAVTRSSGAPVLIRYGPFSGLTGKLVEIEGKNRFLVEFEVVNRSLLIDIPSSYIETINI